MRNIDEYVKKENLLCDGDRVLLGVSGGADSVCLVFSFLDLKAEYDLTLFVLYVEHGIRGEESVRDGAFVEALCRRLSVDYTTVSVDAKSYAKTNHLSLEEAARMLRYDAFYEIAEKRGCNKIATAHNANDNAETILFQMIRGSGRKGLSGIAPKRSMGPFTIIRPLLCVTRAEIEADLIKRNEPYVTDTTNDSDDYARNKIRHRVLPVLQEINAKAIEHINEAGRRIAYLNEEEAQKNASDSRGEIASDPLSLAMLQKMDEESRRETILDWLRGQNAAHDVGRVHLEMISELIFLGVGKEYHLPHGFYVKNDYETLRLLQKTKKTNEDTYPGEADAEDEIVIPPLQPDETCQISLPGLDLTFFLSEGVPERGIAQKNYAKTFDYGKIMGSLVLRHRREGDYLVIHPDGRRKKLKDYLVEQKIPKEERNDLWLLCSGAKVLWILGHRNSEDARVDDTTKQCLTIEYWRS